MRTMLILIIVVMLAVFASATTFEAPRREVVRSLSGEYELVTNPKTGVHFVRSASWPHRRLWSFRGPTEWFYEYFISSDGHRAVVVHWAFCKVDELNTPAVRIYHRGKLERVFSFQELSKPRPHKPGEVGPIGEFWRIWRDEAW